MPSTLNATVGSASANSYVNVTEVSAYFDDRLNAAIWISADGDDRTRALLTAVKRLERENWLGSRVDSTQALSWPRSDVEKIDSPSGSGIGYGYGYFSGELYLTTEIPQQIKDAQCELALSLLSGYGQSGGSTVKSFSADGFSVSFGETRSETSLPESVLRLIAPLIRGAKLVRA